MSYRSCLLVLVTVGVAFAVRGVTCHGEAPDFNPRVVIKRAFPAITDPATVSAKQANETLHDAELVLGVIIGDKARAYPINMLTGPRREIINDKLGQTDLAATW